MSPFCVAVFVYLACAFRYGSEDLDVMGLSFRRDIWIQRVQVYPPVEGNTAKTPMLEFLMKKVGEQGYPFTFQVRNKTHNSLTLHMTNEIPAVPSVTHGVDQLGRCFLFLSFFLTSDADRPPVLSVLTAGAKWFWQGTTTVHFHSLSLSRLEMFEKQIIHLGLVSSFCCRLAAWTLRLKDTSPTWPSMQMKSLKRSMPSFQSSPASLNCRICV